MKLISGAEPGVPRFSCDFAQTYGLSLGGYCLPDTFKGANPSISNRYNLTRLDDKVETIPPFDYRSVLLFNIRHSTHVLILHNGSAPDSRGEFLHDLYGPYGFIGNFGRNVAFEEKKPTLEIDLSKDESLNASLLLTWLKQESPEIICILGPDDTECPMIYTACHGFFDFLMKNHKENMKDIFGITEAEKKPLAKVGGKKKKKTIPVQENIPVQETKPETPKQEVSPPPVIGGKKKKKKKNNLSLKSMWGKES